MNSTAKICVALGLKGNEGLELARIHGEYMTSTIRLIMESLVIVRPLELASALGIGLMEVQSRLNYMVDKGTALCQISLTQGAHYCLA